MSLFKYYHDSLCNKYTCLGLFEASPGSRFSQANLVFIPYCSSDAHLSMGQEFNLDFGPDEGGIKKTFFNGQIIHRTIVQVSGPKKSCSFANLKESENRRFLSASYFIASEFDR